MKDPTTTPTAELLAEWKMLRDRSLFLLGDCLTQNEYAIKEHNAIVPRISSIAAELDRRTADIRNVNGFPAFGNYRQIIYAKNDLNAREAVVKIRIADLRDLLTWLLMKGGAND